MSHSRGARGNAAKPPNSTASALPSNGYLAQVQVSVLRLFLRVRAGWWRCLMSIGMHLHSRADPRPPIPAFVETIPSTLALAPGDIKLYFYVPDCYEDSKAQGKTYPAVVNYHGGGFVLGTPTDDGRFARFVLETCNSVFISVDYRLAPEHPFPTAVDDGADALLYVIHNAARLHIDSHKLATSGFSAGGNIAITALLRLGSHVKTLEASTLPDHRVVAAALWYPILDYTIPRTAKRASCARPGQTLSTTLTSLFDSSYLYPPDVSLDQPLLSPSKAPDEMLAPHVPPHVFLYTCEWDMLLREGEQFAKRLSGQPISKNVFYQMVPGVPHAWDKTPNPLRAAGSTEELYRDCCKRLRNIFQS